MHSSHTQLKEYVYNKCLQIIRDREHLSLTSYRCPSGYNTIGYGCINTKLAIVDSITAEIMLVQHFKVAVGYAQILHPNLSTHKIYCVATILYCVGYGNYMNSTTYKSIVNGVVDYSFIYRTKGHSNKSKIDIETLRYLWNL